VEKLLFWRHRYSSSAREAGDSDLESGWWLSLEHLSFVTSKANV
jgi:hypothetical protein